MSEAPCVFNSYINFNKLKDKSFTDETIGKGILEIFDRLIQLNKYNKYFMITKLPDGKYRIKDV